MFVSPSEMCEHKLYSYLFSLEHIYETSSRKNKPNAREHRIGACALINLDGDGGNVKGLIFADVCTL